MDTYLIQHLNDLFIRSQRQNTYTFSDFLTQEEQSVLLCNRDYTGRMVLYGGADETERSIARFGSEEDLGYVEPFPIVCLKITPLNAKFADPLCHRDYLGALMHLGIERNCIGDIVVRDDTAYVFCVDQIADFITENLHTIRHNDVNVTECGGIPAGKLFQTETLRLTVSSLRTDCLASAACNLSRTKTDMLIREKKLFVNSVLCEKPERLLRPGDRFSIRGYGKFAVKETGGKSKKGKDIVILEKYK